MTNPIWKPLRLCHDSQIPNVSEVVGEEEEEEEKEEKEEKEKWITKLMFERLKANETQVKIYIYDNLPRIGLNQENGLTSKIDKVSARKRRSVSSY